MSVEKIGCPLAHMHAKAYKFNFPTSKYQNYNVVLYELYHILNVLFHGRFISITLARVSGINFRQLANFHHAMAAYTN